MASTRITRIVGASSNDVDTRIYLALEALGLVSQSPSTITTLNGVFPEAGDKAGGYELIIYGINIKPNSIVRVGGTSATVVSNSGSSVSVTVPAHSVGLNDVTVTDSTGVTKTLTNAFTYTEVITELPVISAISSGTPATTEATITFTTDVDCSSYVQWGLTTTYDNSNFPGHDAIDQTSHSHTLTGLTPAVEYHYKISVMDINNVVVSSADGTFTTDTPVTYPVNSAISSGTPTVTGATITWTTDIAASSQVDYGPDNTYGYSTVLDPTLVTSHSVAIAGLTSGTTYHYRVRSITADSAETVSEDGTFLTDSAATLTTNMLWDNTVVPTVENNGKYVLGTKFKTTIAGNILGVRYYKFVNNPTVVVRLWGPTGTLLASRTSSGETASGWQRMDFDVPVAITAETTYTVSYEPLDFAANMQFSSPDNYFATGRTSDKLYAYAGGGVEVLPGNGVVATTVATYPASPSAGKECYYVDPVFQYGTVEVPAGLTITNVNVSNIGQTTATINWTLNAVGTGYYEVGTVQGVYTITNFPGEDTVPLQYSAHSQNVAGLTAETVYYYRVRSTDANGVETISDVNNFTTLAVPVVVGGGTGAGNFHAPAPTSALIVNVKNTGAKGDGTTDDTAAIQAAVNQVGGTGGTVFVPNGTYRINALVSINLKNNMTFKMDTGAVLKAIPTSSATYNIINSLASNVNIVGGTVFGERDEHLGEGNFISYPGNQWGMGISIKAGTNIYIDGVTARACWGDGFYIAGSGSGASNVNMFNCVGDYNRRQGLSIVAVNGMLVRDCIFKNTIGQAPQQGIDIEPNSGTTVNNVKILNNQLLNNHNWGYGTFARAGAVTNVIVDGNIIKGNSGGIALRYANNQRFTNNIIVDKYRAIDLASNTGCTITGNSISSPLPYIVGSTTANVISNNEFIPYV